MGEATAVMILQPDPAPIREQYAPMEENAKKLVISNKLDHSFAQHVLSKLRLAQRDVEELFREPKQKAHAAHRAICSAESKLLTPYRDAEHEVGRKLTVYEREQRAIAEAAQAALEDQARRDEEERMLTEAQAAQDAGAPEEAEAILEAPVVVPPVRVEPELAKVDGVSARTLWRAEKNHPAAFVAWLAQHPEETEMVERATEACRPAVNARARSQREAMRIPGWTAVPEISRAVTREA
jgi:hypothetical protein